jgi:hypothetical protein
VNSRLQVWPIFAAVVASLGLGAAVVASDLATERPWIAVLNSPSAAIPWALGGCGVCVLFAVREIHRGVTDLLARFIPLVYFMLLFLGVAALDVLRELKDAAWPIAATQTLPAIADANHAFVVSLGGGVILTAAVRLGIKCRPRHATPDGASFEWQDIAFWAPILAGVGLVGAAIVTAKTHSIPLFGRNIDALRYSQGNGVGFATLLEYELLAAACFAAAAWGPLRARRPALTLVIACSVVGLVVFRVERLPLIFIVTTMLFLGSIRGRRIRRRAIVAVLAVVVAGAFALGLHRLSSQQGTVDLREGVVRSVFDVAPEFREESFALRIYPRDVPFTGASAAEAVASSVLPSGVLRVAGINKGTVYTDSSRQYSASMRQLGYYTTPKPLRIGLLGELWADFGVAGIVIGLLLFGFVAGRIASSQTSTPFGQLSRAIGSSLCVLALITPLATIFPIALMVWGPVAVLDKLLDR